MAHRFGPGQEEDYAFQRAKEFWEARIAEAYRKWGEAYREFKRRRALVLQKQREFEEASGMALSASRASDIAEKQYEEDKRTWNNMQRGQHPLGQR